MLRVTYGGHFEAAHMLSYYDGKCSNLHGHSYRFNVTLSAAETDDTTRMLLDYNEIKRVVDEVVDNAFDHALLISHVSFREDAEEDLLQWAMKHSKKYFIMPYGKTTSEDMVSVIHERLASSELGVFAIDVQLWETEKNFATWEE